MKKRKVKISLIAISMALTFSIISCDEATSSRVPEITLQPQDLLVQVGDTNDANCLMVEASDPEGDVISYQWLILTDSINGENQLIVGATEKVFIPNKSVTDTSIYFVVVSGTGSSNTEASIGATVIVVDTTVQNIILK